MISLKNKPITLFVAGPILGIGLIIGVAYLIYAAVRSLASIDEMQLAITILGPMILVSLVQGLAYLAISFFVLKSIYYWSSAGIVLNIFLTPLTFAVVTSSIILHYGSYIDLSSPFGIGTLLFFLLGSFALAVIAYNDIKYRKKIISP